MHTNPALLYLLTRESSQDRDRSRAGQARQRSLRARRRRPGRPPGE